MAWPSKFAPTICLVIVSVTKATLSTQILSFPPPPQPAAVVLNGERSPLDPQRFKHYRQVLVTDGAWDDFAVSDAGQTVPAERLSVLGDGDSIQQRPAGFIDAPDQNYTDFDKALQYAVTQGISQADVFWASGGEMDHFLGNLSVAYTYRQRIALRFFDSRQCYWLLSSDSASTEGLMMDSTVANSFSLNGANGRTLSLYPFPEARITSRGLLYPLHNLHLSQHHQQSLRNAVCADTMTLDYRGDAWVFVSLN